MHGDVCVFNKILLYHPFIPSMNECMGIGYWVLDIGYWVLGYHAPTLLLDLSIVLGGWHLEKSVRVTSF